MSRLTACALALALSASSVSLAQPAAVPPEYQQVLTTLNRQGDYAANVLKVNIPRNDLSVTVADVKTPTPFGFGGWVALTKGDGGMDVLMGDLVLTQDEVNPVMSALLDNGLEVTALHNHFFWDEPRVYFMHVHGMGSPAALAAKLKPALAMIGKPATAAPGGAPAPALAFDAAAIARSSDIRAIRPERSTRSPSAGTTWRSRRWARRSTRVWGSILGPRLSGPTPMPLLLATWRCWRPKCNPS